MMLAVALVFGGGMLCPSAVGDGKVRVTADSVNLRAGPGKNYEVVAQAALGDVLAAGTREGDWLEVAVPAGTSLWIYGELVKGGVVAVSKLRVRGGPGINYKPVGRLAKGDRVTVRGEKGEWLEIAPPPGATLWVSSDYVRSAVQERAAVVAPVRVEPPRAAVVKPSVRVSVRPAPPRAAAPKPDPKPRAPKQPPRRAAAVASAGSPAKHRLVASAEQGRQVAVSGVLCRAGWVWRRPSGYRLVKQGEGQRPVTVCYVLGEDARLAPLAGQTLQVRGRQYWLQGVRYPVVTPDAISPDN